jgi:pimeloyl-ACP methyl ester carboxylesterase
VDLVLAGPEDAERLVVLAVGAGGEPSRYAALLEALAERGCRVLAPRHPRLPPVDAPTEELLARPQGLIESLVTAAPGDRPVTVLGHSIGGWAALCLAGALPRQRDGALLPVPREPRVARLVLYAPACGWFAAPDGVTELRVPTTALVGEHDAVTPVAQVRLLERAPAPVEVRVIPHAVHFSAMTQPPPGSVQDPALDQAALVAALADAAAAA